MDFSKIFEHFRKISKIKNFKIDFLRDEKNIFHPDFFYELEFVSTIDWTGFRGFGGVTWMLQRVCLIFSRNCNNILLNSWWLSIFHWDVNASNLVCYSSISDSSIPSKQISWERKQWFIVPKGHLRRTACTQWINRLLRAWMKNAILNHRWSLGMTGFSSDPPCRAYLDLVI